MKITSYEEQKHNKEKLNVYIDGEYSFSITLNGWAKNFLWVGKELSEDEINKIKQEDTCELALSYAYRVIGNGLKTEVEMRRKFKEKAFSEDDIEYAINKLKEYNYINDKYYAECYIKARVIPNKWGKIKAYNMMLQKGIDKDIINESLDELFSEDEEYKIILESAKKKLDTLSNISDKIKIKNKLISFLLNRGFDYSLIKKVIAEIEDDF